MGYDEVSDIQVASDGFWRKKKTVVCLSFCSRPGDGVAGELCSYIHRGIFSPIGYLQ